MRCESLVRVRESLVTWQSNAPGGTSRLLAAVASLLWLKMAALIPSHADCEIRSVIKFLNVQSIAPIEIHRQLCEVYGPDVLSKQMVRRWCRQFTGGRQNVHDEARSGRPSIVTDDLVEQVRQRIVENRRYTIRELSSHFPQISRSSLHEIVSKHLFPKLCASTQNKKKRKPAKKRRAASESDMSSEASKEADENMSEFDADQAENDTVIEQSYLEMFRTWLFPLLQMHPRGFVFQQDGAPPHWSLLVRAFFNGTMPQWWIGRRSAQDRALFAWPPRSPDLTPDNVYVPPQPTTLDDLKERLTRVSNSVDRDMLQCVWEEFAYHLDVVRAAGGGHIENL
ncbi:hypothetical protein ANN_07215 [Periplaneta americana]|uniref:Mos1 transposase HTH domain-containing protein n=1 Tax=Periplaneta americana TaxID=6978 RepID=A0ABQ8TI99_PERAM|nr:hypothetical protein ANN_07215 [Periplaneta americana]